MRGVNPGASGRGTRRALISGRHLRKAGGVARRDRGGCGPISWMRAASIIVAVASLAFAPGAAAAGPQIVDVGTGILPEALNSSDMIVGISTTTQPDGEAFPAYWQNGAAGDLPQGGYLGDPHFPAMDVNDAGRIAGALDVGTICNTCTQISHALYWPSPTSAPGDLGATGESQGINNAGDVVGRHGGAGGNSFAFVAPQGGTPLDVGAMNGD